MQKIKAFFQSEKGKTILIIITVILVGLASFLIGRLSKNPSTGIEIEYPDEMSRLQNVTTSNSAISSAPEVKSAVTPAPVPQNGPFVASSRGTRYYPVDCSAGKNLVEANKIYFNTRAEAEAAGYTPSPACR